MKNKVVLPFLIGLIISMFNVSVAKGEYSYFSSFPKATFDYYRHQQGGMLTDADLTEQASHYQRVSEHLRHKNRAIKK